jgi:glycosyltransferase involved in cell wall biosynthesis
MKVGVHDFAGHPFQLQLSRELAARGHEVVHWYCSSLVTGRGSVESAGLNPAGLTVVPVELGREFERHAAVGRVRSELAFGRALTRAVRDAAPDVVVSANAPLLVQRMLVRNCTTRNIRFVYWQQDVLSAGIRSVGRKKYPGFASIAAAVAHRLESVSLRKSDAVVTISADFVPVVRGMGVPVGNVYVIENWAPIEEIPVLSPDNQWSRAQGLLGRRVVLYAGTLGLKHNPEILLDLSVGLRDIDSDAKLVVISEGVVADGLREKAARVEARNLLVLPFQPFNRFPEVLASATVLLAILDPDAGVFSVPSKILSYHCAGRPILASIPQENLAARMITRVGSGIVCRPDNASELVTSARRLLTDQQLMDMMGRAGRQYAEQSFSIADVAERFERVLLPRSPVPEVDAVDTSG